MRRYTANYTYTNPNFVIQNLGERESKSNMLPLIYVLKNILQRGFPTIMSKYLQEKIGEIHNKDNYEDRLMLLHKDVPHWYSAIKGSEETQYNPARDDFFERIIPNELEEYTFIKSMLVPEIEINEIIGTENQEFYGQKVDFYLPQALLVIEIDGSQHDTQTQRQLDYKRDNYFYQYGIQTVRIKTSELQNNTYQPKINQIIQRLKHFDKHLQVYKSSYEKAIDYSFTEEEINDKLLPTAIIRFQLLLLELLANNYLTIGESWNFNIKCDESLRNFAQLAIEDVYVWLNQLTLLRDKQELTKFDYEISISDEEHFQYNPNSINIDFSLLKKYTDEDKLNPNTIFVRSDYFNFRFTTQKIGRDKNYFRVSTAQSINYNITDNDRETLLFFLRNLFNKIDFREGQFSIIANALNLQDTVGLLPTGGGKSLCYQMPCLLQPSINFVVCPIKSLMYDQMDNLQRGDVKITNINLICGDLSAEEKKTIMRDYSMGRYLFIWISPERFQIKDFRTSLQTIITQFNVAYAVIDEVHCMSEWGHDFRTSYLNLAKTIDKLSTKDDKGEGSIKYIGLTATASVNVLKDIKVEFSRRKQQLEDRNIKTLLDYTRPELDFVVIDDGGIKYQELSDCFTQHSIPEDNTRATLIFTPFVNGPFGCYGLYANLNREYYSQVGWYSGSCPKNNREPIMLDKEFQNYKVKIQDDFKKDKIQVLCATKAFGMGIDKQNIFYTIHYGISSSVEALYQEAGRAGRWDKSLEQNKDKRGTCYVLFSPENQQYKQLADKCLAKDTTVDEMKEILDEVEWNGEDIFRQIRLFLQELDDISVEYPNIIEVINTFFQENTEVTIPYSRLRFNSGKYIAPDNFEKIIYRLSLLGIVKDWTRDFVNSFTIHFNNIEPKHIVESLKSYIIKYDPDEPVEDNINTINREDCETVLEKSVWYLLTWIFNNITNTRKQSLKTLYDWCDEFTDSVSFKQRIEAYFTFNQSTYILQHIAEHSHDYKQWFLVFYTEHSRNKKNKIFISHSEILQLRDLLSRFLESYHNSPGLNFVSGLVRLLLNDFEDSDGRSRMQAAIRAIKEANGGKITKEKEEFFVRLLNLIHNADININAEQKTELVNIIIQYFPQLLEPFAQDLQMPWLYNDIIKEHIKQLKEINKKLYETIGRI